MADGNRLPHPYESGAEIGSDDDDDGLWYDVEEPSDICSDGHCGNCFACGYDEETTEIAMRAANDSKET